MNRPNSALQCSLTWYLFASPDRVPCGYTCTDDDMCMQDLRPQVQTAQEALLCVPTAQDGRDSVQVEQVRDICPCVTGY